MTDMADDLAGTLAVNVYQRAASSLIVGFSSCELDRMGLSQLQQIRMIAAVLSCMDGLERELSNHMKIDADLHVYKVGSVKDMMDYPKEIQIDEDDGA